jgi:hypothetical protein
MDKEWILGVYTSGGSAHERAMEDLCQRTPHVVKINLLSSCCTYLPIIGRFCAWCWNHAQQSGYVKWQILFGKLQVFAEKIFFLPTYFTIYWMLTSRNKILPKKIVATAPLFLSAICQAVIRANQRTRHQKMKSIDLYMVEPPTDDARYYLDTIRNLSLEKKKLLRLFAGHPSEEDCRRFQNEENYWIEKTGLNSAQIVFDPPVKHVFKSCLTLLPCPRDAVEIHLEGYRKPFELRSQDRVGLIMLGGIPTIDAVVGYVCAALLLPLVSQSIQNYLFVACGNKSLGLYEKVCELLTCHNVPPSLQIIPFLNQPVEKIFGRADFSVTRTGGMTSLEIVELKKRKEDDKLILLHAQIHQARAQHLSQEELITQGIPLWEGGNARYLRKSVPDVVIVTPESSALYMSKKFL